MKFYECKVCGKVILLLEDTSVMTVCCGEPMSLMHENTTDGATEKHVPVVTTKGNTVTVTVGEDYHPMTEQHYIKWIILETNLGFQKRDLRPKELPVATFELSENERVIAAYEYCNLHKLWKVAL